jgi:DNA-directed RNA polymerase specialized sigma24 family protein
MPVAPWVRRSRSRTGADAKGTGTAGNGEAAQAGRSGALPATCPAGAKPDKASRDAASPDVAAQDGHARDAAAQTDGAQDDGAQNASPHGLAGKNGAAPGESASGVPVAASAESDADRGLRDMYEKQYKSLVRLAALLVGDSGTAEAVVQDCFVAMHGAWNRLADQDRALSYLHHAIVGRSRSAVPRPALSGPAAEGRPAGTEPATATSAWPEVISALDALAPLQREAVVLRFYLDLQGREIAAAMGISHDDAQAHTAGGMAALRGVL